jgi:hypothetical protein
MSRTALIDGSGRKLRTALLHRFDRDMSRVAVLVPLADRPDRRDASRRPRGSFLKQ